MYVFMYSVSAAVSHSASNPSMSSNPHLRALGSAPMNLSLLSMTEAKLPPGFRFHPRDEELINDYLAWRVAGGQPKGCPLMVDVDLNQVEPWDLPATASVGKEWYFYSQRDRKYATGQRTNRATRSGYWKATGKDRQVADGRRGGKLVGTRKTLVFYRGRAPKGKKTDWVMHEFRMEADLDAVADHPTPPPPPLLPSSAASSPPREDLVLCKVFYKSRGLSSKPKTTDICYDDDGDGGGGSSSLPPLADVYNNFEQPPTRPVIGNDSLHGFDEQVPCFSSDRYCHQMAAATTLGHPRPPQPSPDVRSLWLATPHQLGSSATLPAAHSYLHNPALIGFSGDAKPSIDAVLDHISKGEGGGATAGAGGLGVSSESLVTLGAPYSMWNPF